MARPGPSEPFPRSARFATTHWSLVRAAGDAPDRSSESQEALQALCRLYWYPLYAHIRRRCRNAEEAEDLTQEFFARLIERDDLKVAEPERGRFRSFLLSAANHFLSNQRDYDNAQKRGGGRTRLSIDLRDAESRLAVEPADRDTPERVFERRWALTLLERALARLGEEHSTPDKRELFDQLRPFLPKGEGGTSYRDVGKRLRMSEGAVKVAVHRMRRRFATLLRLEIAQTVASPDEVEDEIHRLFTALSH